MLWIADLSDYETVVSTVYLAHEHKITRSRAAHSL